MNGMLQTREAVSVVRRRDRSINSRYSGNKSRINLLCEVLQEVRVPPFFLPLRGVGVFNSRGRPSVAWAGGKDILISLRCIDAFRMRSFMRVSK
jgi:hypothetical protein